jgi:hypothetical protein
MSDNPRQRRKSTSADEDNDPSHDNHGNHLDAKTEEQYNNMNEIFGTQKKGKKSKVRGGMADILKMQKKESINPEAPLPTVATLRRKITKADAEARESRAESKSPIPGRDQADLEEELEDRVVSGHGSLRTLNRIGRFKASKRDLKSIEEEFKKNYVASTKRSSFEEKTELAQSSPLIEKQIEDLLETLDEKSKVIISTASRTKLGDAGTKLRSSVGGLRPSLRMFETLCYTIVVCLGSISKAEGLLNWLKDVYNVPDDGFENSLLPKLSDPLHVNLWSKARIDWIMQAMKESSERKEEDKDHMKVFRARIEEKKKIFQSLQESIQARITELVQKEKKEVVSHMSMVDKLKVKVGGKKKDEKIKNQVLSSHEKELQTSIAPNADADDLQHYDSTSNFQDLLLLFFQFENMGVDISSEQVVIQSKIHTISPTARQVLERFVEISDVPLHLFYLHYFVLLSKNLTDSEEFFQEVLRLLSNLLELRSGPSSVQWMNSESNVFHLSIAVLFVWCQTCLLWYHVTFPSTEDQQAFKACIKTLKVLREFIESNHIDALAEANLEDSWSKFISKHVELAILRRYFIIVRRAAPPIESSENTPKQAPLELPTKEPMLENYLSSASNQSEDEGTMSDRISNVFNRAKFKFWSASKKEEAQIPVSVEIVKLDDLDEKEFKDMNIKSLKHLVKVLDDISKDVKMDVENRKFAFSEVDGFDFQKVVCNTYFPLVWSDFQLSLRKENQALAKLDAVLHSVHSRLKKFYGLIASVIDLPDLLLQPWFSPFIDRWLDEQKLEFQEKRVKRAIDLDKELPGSKCSSSVIDLFSFLFPMGDLFKLAPYDEAQAMKFAKIVMQIIDLYISMMRDMFLKQLPKAEGVAQATLTKRQDADGESYFEIQYPSRVLSFLNNIITCRQMLQEMLIKVDLEAVYENKPILHDDVVNEVDAKQAVKPIPPKTPKVALSDDDPEGSKVLDELNCIPSFRYIDKTLKEIGKEMIDDVSKLLFMKFSNISQLNGFWEVAVRRFIWNEPIAQEYSQDQVEVELDPVCDNAFIHLKYFKEHILMVTFLQVATFEQLISVRKFALLFSVSFDSGP